MKPLFLMAIFLLSLIVQSEAKAADGFPVDRKLQLEKIMEERVRTFLKPMDGSVQANVEIVFKKKNVNLGGIGYDQVDPLALNPDHPWLQSAIGAVKVKVMSRRKKPEAAVLERVQDIAHLGKVQASLDWEEWPESVAKNIDSESINPQAFREIGQKLVAMLEKSLDYFPAMFAVIVLFIAAVGLFSARLLGKSIASVGEHVLGLGAAIKNMGTAEMPSRRTDAGQPNIAREKSIPVPPAPSYELNGMGAGLRTLFWDCYWTEQDSYANWLWQRLSIQDKQRLFSEDGALKPYVDHFSGGPASELAYHSHPYYLAPFDFTRTSQADISKTLKTSPGLWAILSPMRCDFMPLNLTERLRMVQAPPLSGPVPNLPVSSQRNLRGGRRLGSMTLEDEGLVMDKPDLIPSEMCGQLPSLVWLALMPESRAREILSKFSADELAQAWIGHASVLERLGSLLPEKKFALVTNYLGKTKPSRDSDSYKQLCSYAIEGMKQNDGPQADQKAA